MKNLLIFLLLVLSAFLFYRFVLKDTKISGSCAEKEFIQGNLNKFIAFKDGILKYAFKAADEKRGAAQNAAGNQPLPAEIKNICLPREGSFVYREFTDGKNSLDIKTCGLTFKPYAGAQYRAKEGISPVLGVRLLYFGRWGAGGVYGVKSGCFLSAERRLDDIPFLSNSALFFGINKKTATFGAAVFL